MSSRSTVVTAEPTGAAPSMRLPVTTTSSSSVSSVLLASAAPAACDKATPQIPAASSTLLPADRFCPA